jgi:hypothetical protein
LYEEHGVLQVQHHLSRKHTRSTHTHRTLLIAQASTKVSETRTATQTQRIFQEIEERDNRTAQAGGAGGSTTYAALKGADSAWLKLRNAPTGSAAGPAPVFVREEATKLGKTLDFDVTICGGTLGIFLACALQVWLLHLARDLTAVA